MGTEGTIKAMQVRKGSPLDFPGIREIQEVSPEASQWDPSEEDGLLVAEFGDARIAGFLVWRAVAPDEAEILNLAVDPQYRRRGVARELLRGLPLRTIFLEVRESNQAALALYRTAGFQQVGTRPQYYQNPNESAIVMRLQS